MNVRDSNVLHHMYRVKSKLKESESAQADERLVGVEVDAEKTPKHEL